MKYKVVADNGQTLLMNLMYCKAIEEYKNALLKLIKEEQDTRYGYLNEMDIREVAEQLKAGEKI